MSSTQDELDINGSDPLDKLNIAEPIPATFTALEQQKEDYKHVVKVLKNAKDIGNPLQTASCLKKNSLF